MKTRLIIVAAPSGAGKSSFVDRIVKEDSRLEDVITYTTRSMRRGEVQGHPYHFISRSEFEQKIKEDFFVEHALVHTNMYGIPWNALKNTWDQGKCVIMDIDVQGTVTLKNKFPEAKAIFILPPSIDELRRRIEIRDGKLPADIDIRMSNAQKEMAQANQFDFTLINDDFDRSYAEFKKIIDELL